MCDEARQTQEASAGQLRPAYPHQNLNHQIRRTELEAARLTRAKEFLDRHPEFGEFLTLIAEGTLHVSR